MLKSYNNFTPWEAQDDFLTAGGRLLETHWVTGLRDWYWLTIWPKTNKKVLTNNKIKGFILAEYAVNNDDRNYLFWDAWEIYRFSSTDLTPIYTHTLGYSIRWAFFQSFYTFFLAENNGLYSIMRVLNSDIDNGTFASMNETFIASGAIVNLFTPPIIQIAWQVYIWWNSTIVKYDNTMTATSYPYFSFGVVWITIHQWTFLVYCNLWLVYFWNWLDSADASFSNSSQNLWFKPSKVVQIWELDYIVSDDWQLYVWSWASAQQITYKKQSNRWNDNSQYVTRQDFTPSNSDWQMLEVARGRIYIAENWIYEYWSLYPWMPTWLHKSIAYNNAWVAYDDIYSMKYNPLTRQLLFWYKAGAEYWVDYIDLDSKETNQYWYAVTEVFAGYQDWIITFEKKLEAIRYTFLNTSWNNYIKLYKRVNNGAWELFETINKATDIVDYKDLRTQKDSFLDLQFKIELYNDSKGINPPILPWLELQYGIKPQ